MENVKAFAVKQLNDLTTSPVSFAFNLLGIAVAVWFSSIILNLAIHITMQSFAIITSAF